MAAFDVKIFLEEQGYPVKDCGEYLQTAAKWRGGDDCTSVAVYPKTNVVIDFAGDQRGNIEWLVSKVLGIRSRFELKRWLQDRGMQIQGMGKSGSIITVHRTFPADLPDSWEKDYGYFVGRGISPVTLELFRGGVCQSGRMAGRFCFAVYDSGGKIIGIFGRSLDEQRLPKYKILGPKKQFVWPAFFTVEDIRVTGEIVLVESPVCVMRLYDCGIRHALCLFGIELSVAILNFCIKMNPRRIIVATNNEPSKTGNQAAHKVAKRLRRFFDGDQVLVNLPIGAKDFADPHCNIAEWRRRI